MTNSRTHDGTAALPLLDQVDSPLDTFYGDGAYDQQKVYDALEKRSAWTIIPPHKNAKANPGNRSLERDTSIQEIQRNGREAWNEAVGDHHRSLAKTTVRRLKSAFGDRLKNRKPPNQKTEIAIRAKLLNWFVTLGMPLSLWI